MNNKIILSTKSNKSRIWQAMLGTMTFFISSAGMEETGPFHKLSILDTLRSEIKRSEEQIKSITEIIESKKRDMKKKANREIEEAESKIQKANREIEEAESKIKEADSEIQKADREIEKADREIEEARSKIEEADREIEEAESKIQKAEREIKEAKFQIKVKLESIESINEL